MIKFLSMAVLALMAISTVTMDSAEHTADNIPVWHEMNNTGIAIGSVPTA